MIVTTVKYRGHRCFKDTWAGFDLFRPINVLIGRNNTGKSHLLDFAEALCNKSPYRKGWQCSCEGILDEASLKQQFQAGHSGGDLPDDHWGFHGHKLIGLKITWTVDENGQINELILPPPFNDNPQNQSIVIARKERIKRIAQHATHSLTGCHFRRLLADRDIQPETENEILNLSFDGKGATNIVRRYIVSASDKFPRELIQKELLSALNEIFRGDGKFTEIEMKVHDEQDTGSPYKHWEVYLGEHKKGLVSLSRSGSGLKTVLLVLLILLVIPHFEKRPKHQYVFAFEELENNLHPALLRHLLQYLETYATREEATILLTTHSSVALDIFGMSKNAQIIHVTHDGEFARAETVAAHFDHLGVISELGAKPSDLLQANGIIWVEGPSDRIYLNRWINLFSEGKLQEGRDYQCAFYGGALLARTQFVTPEEAEAELTNLFRVNSNIIVVCDSDRTAIRGAGSELKDRVRRIAAEIQKIPGAHIWITEAKEIENYLPGSVLGNVFKIETIPDPKKHERFFPSESSTKRSRSFVESHLKRKTIDKMDLAQQAALHMTKEGLSKRFDLGSQIEIIIKNILRWNS